MPPIPVLSVCSVDPVLRDSTAAALMLDLAGAVAVRHDVSTEGLLHRHVYDWQGTRDQATEMLDHGCLWCALRADLLPVLRGLSSRRSRPDAIVVVLPVSFSPLPLVRDLQPGGGGLVKGCRPAAVVAAMDPITLMHDLFADDLLVERKLALGGDDRRSVGEALAAQLEYADAIVTPTHPETAEEQVLAHLNLWPTGRIYGMHADQLVQVGRRVDDPRGDMLRVRRTGAADSEHVWTLQLQSTRPFHPDRLHESIEALGAGRTRGRGAFWLPTRPGTVGVWDGAGGQLSIGTAGQWPPGHRRTRLVVTGIGDEAGTISAAFAHALTTDVELSRGEEWWTGRDDGFDPWLGGTGELDEDLSA